MTFRDTCATMFNAIFPGSSMVEHPAVNRRVIGSSPIRGVVNYGRDGSKLIEKDSTFLENSIGSMHRDWKCIRVSSK